MPQHPVSFSYDWYMDSTGVTVTEFAEVMNWALPKGLIEVKTAQQNGGRWIATTKDSLVDVANVTSILSSSSDYLDYNALKGAFQPAFSQNYPMISVTWFGAAYFANLKSLKNGLEPVYDTKTWRPDHTKNGYRLPTEAVKPRHKPIPLAPPMGVGKYDSTRTQRGGGGENVAIRRWFFIDQSSGGLRLVLPIR